MNRAKSSATLPIPNIITSLRMFLGFLLMCFVWAAAANGNPLWTIVVIAILFIIIVFSDFLDGYAARFLKMTSSFGKVFDQIADKICINIILIYLASQHVIFFIFPVILISRDLIVNGIRVYKASRTTDQKNSNYVIPAGKLGKIKTCSLFMGIVLIFLILIISIAHSSSTNPNIPIRWSNFAYPKNELNIFSHGVRIFVYNFVLIIPVLFALVSLISYIYTHLLSKNNKRFIYETIFNQSLSEPHQESYHRKKRTSSANALPRKKSRLNNHQQLNNLTEKQQLLTTKQKNFKNKRITLEDQNLTDMNTQPENNETEQNDQKLLLDETVQHDLRDVAAKVMHDDKDETLVNTGTKKREHYDIHDYIEDEEPAKSEHPPYSDQKYETVTPESKTDKSANSPNQILVREATKTNVIAKNVLKNVNSQKSNAQTGQISRKQNRIDPELESTMSDLFIDPSQIIEYDDSDSDNINNDSNHEGKNDSN